jgi:hypothetical protein
MTPPANQLARFDTSKKALASITSVKHTHTGLATATIGYGQSPAQRALVLFSHRERIVDFRGPRPTREVAAPPPHESDPLFDVFVDLGELAKTPCSAFPTAPPLRLDAAIARSGRDSRSPPHHHRP